MTETTAPTADNPAARFTGMTNKHALMSIV